MVSTRMVGTPTMDLMIRQVLAQRESTKDMLRGEI
jgi:hypothetical protein